MLKRRTTADLIIEMSRLGDKLGHPPTQAEVTAESKKGNMATAITYLRRLGLDTKTKKQTWGTVLEACGMKMPPDRHGRGRKLDPTEKARRNKLAEAKKMLREQQAKEKRIAKFQAEKAKAAKQQELESVKKESVIAASVKKHVFGRTEIASDLKLVNLTGYSVQLKRGERLIVLPPAGKIVFSSENCKFLEDETVRKELAQLFGEIETRRISTPFYIFDANNERHMFPEVTPGTYYIVSRKQAELIASTGRSAEDLVFPLQYHAVKEKLYIDTIGIKLNSSSKIVKSPTC